MGFRSKTPAPSPEPLTTFDAANRVPRRVPAPTLRPPLAICKPTAVTLGPGRRIAIMPDKGGVAEALAERLRASGVEVLLLDATPVAGPVIAMMHLSPTLGVGRTVSQYSSAPSRLMFSVSIVTDEPPGGQRT